ncbi:MAG: DUF2914 domain-containing protein [Candidatus Zixiibacteriota bacterium]
MLKKILIISMALFLLLAVTIFAQGEDTTKPAEPEPTPAPVEEPVPAEPIFTVETQLCGGIVDRMPVEPAETFSADVENVYLWCKVTGALDSTSIFVNWYYQDKEMASVELPVKSAFWRTWSSKRIQPEWVGDWTVRVLNKNGNGIKEIKFTITEPAPVPETPAETETTPPPAPEPVPEDTAK